MISHKFKFIFVHISRTGGTSIERRLGRFCESKITLETKHLSAIDYKRYDETLWKDYFAFSIVRNPWDRILSYYTWRKSKPWGVEAHHKTFDEWLTYVRDCRKGRQNVTAFKDFAVAINQQFDLVSENNEILVDFVGRFENLQRDFNKICDRIGIRHRALRMVFKTGHQHYSRYYSNYTRDIIAELYDKDIHYFGYTFEK